MQRHGVRLSFSLCKFSQKKFYSSLKLHNTAEDNPFKKLGICFELIEALKEQGIHVPTQIQNRGIPCVLSGKNTFIGAETGAGKTLAFLLPVVQLLKSEEQGRHIERLPNRPRCLIFSPNRELGEQICKVAKTLSHSAKFSCTELVGGRSREAEEASMAVPRDIVVATPGRFSEHLSKKSVLLSELRHIIFDEADYLFSRLGFRDVIGQLMVKLENHVVLKNRNPQIIASAALKTLEVDSFCRYYCPNTTFVLSDRLHQLPLENKVQAMPFYLEDATDKPAKLEALVKEISQTSNDSKAIVFCNTVDSCRFVSHLISKWNEKGEALPPACYHGEMPPKERRSNWIRFLEKDAGFLVCTDLAARGLDVPSVNCIIMYDFPKTTTSYLHRVGRIRNRGTVFCFITRSSRKIAELCLSSKSTRQHGNTLIDLPE
eukprot:jgi/Galph1/1058/GphlegSOOS_G5827.1